MVLRLNAGLLGLLLMAASCSGILDYEALTFGESGPRLDGGKGGSSPDASSPDASGGAAGGPAGAAGGGGIPAGGAAGAAGSAGSAGTAGTAGSAGTAGIAGSAGTGGEPPVCQNGVCEPGEDCSGCAADCACADGSDCAFASPPGHWTCICSSHAFCDPGKCIADRCNCDAVDGGTLECDPGKSCAPTGGCAP